MWDELREEVAIQQELIERLFSEYRELATRCRQSPPDAVGRAALAAFLHAFYTGVENIFKRIRAAYSETLPRSDTWHRDMLDTMARPGPNRPLVISEGLRRELKAYLDFRHMFRQAYTFELRWEKMADLVLNCEQVWRRTETELQTFLDAISQGT